MMWLLTSLVRQNPLLRAFQILKEHKCSLIKFLFSPSARWCTGSHLVGSFQFQASVVNQLLLTCRHPGGRQMVSRDRQAPPYFMNYNYNSQYIGEKSHFLRWMPSTNATNWISSGTGNLKFALEDILLKKLGHLMDMRTVN